MLNFLASTEMGCVHIYQRRKPRKYTFKYTPILRFCETGCNPIKRQTSVFSGFVEGTETT